MILWEKTILRKIMEAICPAIDAVPTPLLWKGSSTWLRDMI
jgi:hypothetical protein